MRVVRRVCQQASLLCVLQEDKKAKEVKEVKAVKEVKEDSEVKMLRQDEDKPHQNVVKARGLMNDIGFDDEQNVAARDPAGSQSRGPSVGGRPSVDTYMVEGLGICSFRVSKVTLVAKIYIAVFNFSTSFLSLLDSAATENLFWLNAPSIVHLPVLATALGINLFDGVFTVSNVAAKLT